MSQRVSISELWQGESRQPDWKKLPGQLPTIVNHTLDVLDGARKRNATDLVADISGTILNPAIDYYVTSLRQYRIFIGNNQIVALDADGTQIEIVDQTASDFEYIQGAGRDDIDTTSSIDTIVVLNRNVKTEMEATDHYDVISEVINFSDLFKTPDAQDDPDPTEQHLNSHFRVLEDENLDAAGYYKKTAATVDGDDEDKWERCPAPDDIDGRVSRETWPHRLVYNTDTNQFAWDRIPFNDRLSGNTDTNQAFPFVDYDLQAVQFFSSRLFFIGRDSVNSTAASDIFTVFADNVNNLTDDDRISLDITQKNVGVPLRCEVVGEALVIICENGQLTFGSADEKLTAINGRIRQIKDFKALDIYPGTDGHRLLMMDSDKSLRVFQWDETSRTVAYIGSTTEHVVGLFDNQTIDSLFLRGDTTFVQTGGSRVFVHDMYFVANEMRQSAWSKYDFNEDVKYIDAWGDRIRLVTLGETWTLSTYLHRKAILETGWAYSPRLDRRQLLEGIYLADLDQTQFELENRDADEEDTFVVTTRRPDGEWSQEFFQPVWVNNRKFRINGKWTGYEHYVGWVIRSELEFQKVWPGAAALRTMLSGVNIFRVETTDYDAEINQRGRTVRTVEWNGGHLNEQSMNFSGVTNGVHRILTLGDARETTVKVKSNTPGSVTVSAVEYLVTTKGRG